jgi:hypothetical protein
MSGTRARKNKFASACFAGDGEVAAGEGLVTLVNGDWRVTHYHCSAFASFEAISAHGGPLREGGFHERLMYR